MGELEEKVAVVTGAGSGMARASAKVFVREGARILGAAKMADVTVEEFDRITRVNFSASSMRFARSSPRAAASSSTGRPRAG